MIPEIEALDARPNVIRVPHQIDVPVTKRILRLIDTQAFQRLSRISQLGLVARVYPGATHTRFEHSLGVYRNALLFARRLGQFEQFRNQIDDGQLEAFLVASLLHDIGHWPYCHPIEDMNLPEIPDHELVAAAIISGDEISSLLRSDWNLDRGLVIRLIAGESSNSSEQLLSSIISGPIDIDKMDYLYRDSLHCGVPYGMNFDSPRLINSICLNQDGDGIAISSKGKTAAEMMVFARYVMFSEVYWHHAVRSATAIIQRIFYAWSQQNGSRCNRQLFAQLDERSMVQELVDSKSAAADLSNCMFGTKRQLYKRLLDYNANQNSGIYSALAHQPYDWLVEKGQQLVQRLSAVAGTKVGPTELLIDAPPPGLEVQFRVQVNEKDEFRSLEDISPVVRALAERQFDDFVKRVRVFVHPRLIDSIDKNCAEQCLRELLDNS